MRPILTAATEIRIEGRIKGLEEAKHVVLWATKDQNLAKRITLALDIRIRELKRSKEQAA